MIFFLANEALIDRGLEREIALLEKKAVLKSYSVLPIQEKKYIFIEFSMTAGK